MDDGDCDGGVWASAVAPNAQSGRAGRALSAAGAMTRGVRRPRGGRLGLHRSLSFHVSIEMDESECLPTPRTLSLCTRYSEVSLSIARPISVFQWGTRGEDDDDDDDDDDENSGLPGGHAASAMSSSMCPLLSSPRQLAVFGKE
ncbi:hypothetical protein LX36DRAFT_43083 [Colletotrichum falcatum]|nr:hypothetical protein LX36DRAFT_43083 [Colletotrichum falcatum]